MTAITKKININKIPEIVKNTIILPIRQSI